MLADGTRPLIVAEPTPRPAARAPVVVDCSVIAAAVFAEAQGMQAWQRLEGRSLHAPWLLDIEMGSVALRKSKTGDVSLVSAALGHFQDLEITRYTVDIAAIVELARRYALTAYDAAYLLIAAELRAPLLTFDARLGSAARQHLGSLE